MKPSHALALACIMLLSTTTDVRATDKPSAELTMITQEAAQGDPGAQLLYGLALLEGRYNLTPNPKKGYYWLLRSARDNQPYAQLVVGNLCAEGKGTKKDPAHAVYWWRKAALNNNPVAQYKLGKAYLNGTGTRKNPSKAIHWLTKSAEQGNNDARYLIGKMYYEGYAVAQDKELGRHWLDKAAEQGQIDAINFLAAVDKIIHYTTMVHQQSADVLLAQAKNGNAQAQYELGLRYENGAYDVDQDNKQALYWLTKAAENGNRNAMHALAHIYETGQLGVNPDSETAAAWKAKAKIIH